MMFREAAKFEDTSGDRQATLKIEDVYYDLRTGEIDVYLIPDIEDAQFRRFFGRVLRSEPAVEQLSNDEAADRIIDAIYATGNWELS